MNNTPTYDFRLAGQQIDTTTVDKLMGVEHHFSGNPYDRVTQPTRTEEALDAARKLAAIPTTVEGRGRLAAASVISKFSLGRSIMHP